MGLDMSAFRLLLDFLIVVLRIGFDVDKTKIENINNGKSYIEHIDSNKILSCVEQGFSATTVFSVRVAMPKYVFQHINIYETDLTHIESTIESMLPYLEKSIKHIRKHNLSRYNR